MSDKMDKMNEKWILSLPCHDILCIDCEMIESIQSNNELASVCILCQCGKKIVDTVVNPFKTDLIKEIKRQTVDFRTWITNLRPKDFINQPSTHVVVKKLKRILKQHKILGKNVLNDLRSMNFNSDELSKLKIIELEEFKQFRDENNRIRSLKKLCQDQLQVETQNGYHSAQEDAKNTLDLYKILENENKMELADTYSKFNYLESLEELKTSILSKNLEFSLNNVINNQIIIDLRHISLSKDISEFRIRFKGYKYEVKFTHKDFLKKFIYSLNLLFNLQADFDHQPKDELKEMRKRIKDFEN